MAPAKPRNSTFKDSVVAQLALQAHFAIADNHPTDKTGPDLAKLMLQHNPSAPLGTSAWSGEYYAACKDFEMTNKAEMQQNSCTIDQFLKGTQSSYFSGDALWRKAIECKRIMLNEIHTVFCQEVCPRWPTLPSGTTTLDPMMLELRKKSWSKKAQELKDGKVLRAESKVQDARKEHDAAKLQAGPGIVTPTVQATAERINSAVKELETAKADELPDFESEWFPTLWKAYMVF